MKRILKWAVIVLAGIVGLLIVAVVALSAGTTRRLNRTYELNVPPVAFPEGETAIAAGEHLAMVRCMGCHGDDLAGTVVFDDQALAFIASSNLTAGAGGVGATYSDEDWVRAIQHGVGPDNRPLLIMPAAEFYYLSDADLGNLIAYLKSLPPVDNDPGQSRTTLLGRTLIAAGAFGDIINAETIDHERRPAAPPPGVTAAYGDYLINSTGCRTCHGAELAGGKHPDPAAPPVPNLTRGGELGAWSEEDFIRALREGQTPSGRQLQAAFMPWSQFRHFTDEELQAIWLYLQEQPARETVLP